MLYFTQKHSSLVKIVYAQARINNKLELVPLKLYADGSLERNQ